MLPSGPTQISSKVEGKDCSFFQFAAGEESETELPQKKNNTRPIEEKKEKGPYTSMPSWNGRHIIKQRSWKDRPHDSVEGPIQILHLHPRLISITLCKAILPIV